MLSVKRSFRLRLILSYVFVVAISFSLIAFFIDRGLEDRSFQDIKSALVSQNYLIENQIPRGSFKNSDTAYFDSLAKELGPKIKCRITFINAQGKVLADSDYSQADVLAMDNHISRPEVLQALTRGTGIDKRYSYTKKSDMFYVAIAAKDGGQAVGIVRLALPALAIDKTLFSIKKIIFTGLILAVILALIFGFIFTKLIFKPLNRLIDISRRISQDDFSQRIRQHGEDEIGELAEAINKMAQGIEDKIKEVSMQNQHLKAIFNSMIEGVIVIDKSGRIVSINGTIEKIFDISRKNAENKIFLEVIRNNELWDIVDKVIKEGSIIFREITLDWPVQRILKINASSIFENTSVSGCLLVLHDVTEIRKLEKIRSDFVANVSHELKTPLTSIKGFVETLLEGALEDKQNSRQFLKIIQDHTNRLNNLINDLLELSYLESEEVSLEKNEINLTKLVDKVLTGFKTEQIKNNIKIENNLPQGLTLRVNDSKIEQVFINLVDNAIKFNRENGFIRIYNEYLGAEVKIIIEDSGVGIPQKDISRIFERFYRVDRARSRQMGGTGLGLSIVKHIVELHGGKVGVESTEGLGSKFWFILPR